jgi:hypothetical protein
MLQHYIIYLFKFYKSTIMKVKLNWLKVQGLKVPQDKDGINKEIVNSLNDKGYNRFAIVDKKIVESWEDEFGSGTTHWGVWCINETPNGGVESVDIFSRI